MEQNMTVFSQSILKGTDDKALGSNSGYNNDAGYTEPLQLQFRSSANYRETGETLF